MKSIVFPQIFDYFLLTSSKFSSPHFQNNDVTANLSAILKKNFKNNNPRKYLGKVTKFEGKDKSLKSYLKKTTRGNQPPPPNPCTVKEKINDRRKNNTISNLLDQTSELLRTYSEHMSNFSEEEFI